MNNVYIALLRGVNVGGHNKMPMADLRILLSHLGFQDVMTYIQSGNVVFKFNKVSTFKIEVQIKDAIKNHFGFEIPVIIKTISELKSIFNHCPFPQEQKEQSYFNILYAEPKEQDIEEISGMSYPDEDFIITKKCIYLYCKNGYGRTKFNSNFFEKKLKTIATTRNYKTILKLLSLSAEIN